MIIPEIVNIDPGIDLLRVRATDQAVSLIGDLSSRAISDTTFDLEPTFRKTVDAYASLTPEEIAARLDNRYGGNNPLMIGFLVLRDTRAVGMMTIGKVGVEWRSDDQELHALDDERGVNFSQWYLKEFRGQGMGKSVARWRLGLMRNLVSYDPDWQNRIPWTSIRRENHSSIRITEGLHAFERVGTHTLYEDKEGSMQRDIWVANHLF
jgi:RimJ/RimL family protein N-acetyltransferase